MASSREWDSATTQLRLPGSWASLGGSPIGGIAPWRQWQKGHATPCGSSIPSCSKAHQLPGLIESTFTGNKQQGSLAGSQYVMRDNPERIAWLVLLISFFVCVSSAVAFPLGIRSFVLHSTVDQLVVLDVQRPPLRVTLAGRGEPMALDREREIPRATSIATDETSGRLVFQATKNDNLMLATVQLYDYTEVTLSEARSPRFGSSPLSHEMVLELISGRLRITIPGEESRPTSLVVHTDLGQVTLAEGTYEVKVNGSTTEVIVSSGRATIEQPSGDSLSLATSQRASIENGRMYGPLPAARNLIQNGDFQMPLSDSWTVYTEQKESPAPTVRAVIEDGVPAASFYRVGSNHAEAGIYQDVNYDVRDFTYLELRLGVHIIYESIAGFGGCGTLSSECPIMVRIDYKDTYGTDREWLQGFYIDEPAPDWLIYPWTLQLPARKWQTYDSGNLMEYWDDNPPAVIKRVAVYASGHSFHALITDLELLAEE